MKELKRTRPTQLHKSRSQQLEEWVEAHTETINLKKPDPLQRVLDKRYESSPTYGIAARNHTMSNVLLFDIEQEAVVATSPVNACSNGNINSLNSSYTNWADISSFVLNTWDSTLSNSNAFFENSGSLSGFQFKNQGPPPGLSMLNYESLNYIYMKNNNGSLTGFPIQHQGSLKSLCVVNQGRRHSEVINCQDIVIEEPEELENESPKKIKPQSNQFSKYFVQINPNPEFRDVTDNRRKSMDGLTFSTSNNSLFNKRSKNTFSNVGSFTSTACSPLLQNMLSQERHEEQLKESDSSDEQYQEEEKLYLNERMTNMNPRISMPDVIKGSLFRNMQRNAQQSPSQARNQGENVHNYNGNNVMLQHQYVQNQVQNSGIQHQQDQRQQQSQERLRSKEITLCSLADLRKKDKKK